MHPVSKRLVYNDEGGTWGRAGEGPNWGVKYGLILLVFFTLFLFHIHIQPGVMKRRFLWF
jgi:hypothetical protein